MLLECLHIDWVVDSMDAQPERSAKAVNSPIIREGLKKILQEQLRLYEKPCKPAKSV